MAKNGLKKLRSKKCQNFEKKSHLLNKTRPCVIKNQTINGNFFIFAQKNVHWKISCSVGKK